MFSITKYNGMAIYAKTGAGIKLSLLIWMDCNLAKIQFNKAGQDREDTKRSDDYHVPPSHPLAELVLTCPLYGLQLSCALKRQGES